MQFAPAEMAAAQRAFDNATPADSCDRCSLQHLDALPVLVSFESDHGHAMLTGVSINGEQIDTMCFSAMQLESWRHAIQRELDDEAAEAFAAQCEVSVWGGL